MKHEDIHDPETRAAIDAMDRRGMWWTVRLVVFAALLSAATWSTATNIVELNDTIVDLRAKLEKCECP